MCHSPLRLPKLSLPKLYLSCWKASTRLFQKRPTTRPICSCEQCCLALAFLTSCEGIQALLAATGDAESLVRLGTCSRSLRHSVFSCCVDWMELGLGQAVGRLGENHIFFGYGGGTMLLKESIPFLRRLAQLARRFDGAKIHIDAHAGARAPGRFVAKNCSQARAKAILRELLHQGAPVDQISFTAWGKEISSTWEETDERVARAEVYVQLGNSEWPERPAYYLKADRTAPVAAEDTENDWGFLHSDPGSLMLFLPAATGFQLVSVLNSA